MGLALALGGMVLAIAPPSYGGSVPGGTPSGVNPGGSTFLPYPGTNLGGQIQEGLSPNEVVGGGGGAGSLPISNPSQGAQMLGAPGRGMNPRSPVPTTMTVEVTDVPLSKADRPRAKDDPGMATVPVSTLADLAETVAAASLAEQTVVLTNALGTLAIIPTDPGAIAADAAIDSPPPLATAVYTAAGEPPVVLPLQGNEAQVANAAGFLAMAFGSDLTPMEVAPFTTLALAGADFATLVDLFNATAGLLTPSPAGGTSMMVNLSKLAGAIQAYNQLLDGSDDATVLALAQSDDFVDLGRSLQQLRAAVDL
jgi:hypothetical protein